MPSGFVDQRGMPLEEGDSIYYEGKEARITKVSRIPESVPGGPPQGIIRLEAVITVKMAAPYPGGVAPCFKLPKVEEDAPKPKAGIKVVGQ